LRGTTEATIHAGTGAPHERSLVTEEQRAALLVNGRLAAAGEPIDPLPVVRLFTPDAHATWLLAALDPVDGDTAYGLIDLGIGMPELGGEAVRPGFHRRAAQAARDAGSVFPGGAPAVGILRLAQENGSIVD
jgi:hypothetical protein